MSPEEWGPIAVELRDAGFKGEFTPENARTYYRFLAVYEAVEVEAAIHGIVTGGSPWMPAASEIVKGVEDLRAAANPVPTWDDARAMFQRAVRHFGLDAEQAATAGLYERHPYFGLYVQRHGWRRLMLEEVDDPKYGGAVRKRLEAKWDELVAEQQDRRRQGLAIAALRAGGSVNGPRQLDALAALGERRQIGTGG